MPLGKSILILGAGNQTSGNAVNHDITKHSPAIDIAWDLNNLPWPWLTSRFDAIVARAVFEHLNFDLMTAMNEAWRIGAPGCVIDVKLPYWRSEISYNDPSHHYPAGLGIFNQFDPSTVRGKAYTFYTPCKWTIQRCELNKGGTSVLAKLKSLKGERV